MDPRFNPRAGKPIRRADGALVLLFKGIEKMTDVLLKTGLSLGNIKFVAGEVVDVDENLAAALIEKNYAKRATAAALKVAVDVEKTVKKNKKKTDG